MDVHNAVLTPWSLGSTTSLYVLRPGDVPEGGSVDAYYSRGVAVYK